MFERLLQMLGLSPKPKYKNASIGPNDVSRAIQRNEAASTEARRELEKIRMTESLRDIAGKIK
jgi:hypothetical protein